MLELLIVARPDRPQRLLRAVGDGADDLAQAAPEADGRRTAAARARRWSWPSTPTTSCPPCRSASPLIGMLTGLFGGDAIGAADRRLAGRTCGRTPGSTPARIGIGTAVALITAGSVIFGELMPKRLALTNAGTHRQRWSRMPLHWLSRSGHARSCSLLGAINRVVLRMLRHLDDARSAHHRRRDPPAGERKPRAGRDRRRRTQHDEPRAAPGRPHRREPDDAAHAHRLAGRGGRPSRTTSRPCARRRSRAIPVYRGNDADVVGVLEVKSLLDRPRQDRSRTCSATSARAAVRVRIHARAEAAGDLPRGTAVAGAGGRRIRRHPGPGHRQRPDGRGARPPAVAARTRRAMRWWSRATTARCWSTAALPIDDLRELLGGDRAARRGRARLPHRRRHGRSRTSAASRTSANTSTGPAGGSKWSTWTARASTSCCCSALPETRTTTMTTEPAARPRPRPRGRHARAARRASPTATPTTSCAWATCSPACGQRAFGMLLFVGACPPSSRSRSAARSAARW